MIRMNKTEITTLVEKHLFWVRSGMISMKVEPIIFRNVDLSHYDFSNKDLSRIRFFRCNLSYCDFTNTKLVQSAIINCDVKGSFFGGANLTRCAMNDNTFVRTDFERANLSYCDLSESSLLKCNLDNSKLNGAILWNTTGNGYQIKTFNFSKYNVVMTKSYIQIGCKRFTPNQWARMSIKNIERMDLGALEWWGKHKDLVLQLHNVSFDHD